MGKHDETVLTVLRAKPGEWMGPTEVGLAMGLPYVSASSRIVPVLRRLMANGLVERMEPARYRAVVRDQNTRDHLAECGTRCVWGDKKCPIAKRGPMPCKHVQAHLTNVRQPNDEYVTVCKCGAASDGGPWLYPCDQACFLDWETQRMEHTYSCEERNDNSRGADRGPSDSGKAGTPDLEN